MRISDWSSDVCSSDLGGMAADQVVGIDEFHDRQTGPGNALVGGMGRAAVVLPLDGHAGPAGSQPGQQGRRVIGRPVVDEDVFPFEIAGLVADRRQYVGDPRPRSAEHTSELQSLMRNSYAVFSVTQNKQT